MSCEKKCYRTLSFDFDSGQRLMRDPGSNKIHFQCPKCLDDEFDKARLATEGSIIPSLKALGIEKRSFDGNLRISIDDKIVTLRGTAIPYNKLSTNPIPGLPNIKERILPGAFKRSVESGANIFMLWNHEMKYVFGRTSNGTLKLKEDQNGVSFENVPPDTHWVKDLIPSIERKDISNMSFSFADNIEPSWSKEDGWYVRNVRDATLYEISVVTLPVYESTSVFARSEGIDPDLREYEIWSRFEILKKKLEE